MWASGGRVFKTGEAESVHMLNHENTGVFEREQGGVRLEWKEKRNNSRHDERGLDYIAPCRL